VTTNIDKGEVPGASALPALNSQRRTLHNECTGLAKDSGPENTSGFGSL
jgi:hypothetical protein